MQGWRLTIGVLEKRDRLWWFDFKGMRRELRGGLQERASFRRSCSAAVCQPLLAMSHGRLYRRLSGLGPGRDANSLPGGAAAVTAVRRRDCGARFN